jgi:hypothetical protein
MICGKHLPFHPTEELNMRYLCLVYFNEKTFGNNPDSPLDSECQASADAFGRAGRMLDGNALQPVSTARTVRVRDGRASVTDGPFAETKEQLGGFYLVDVESMDEAIEIAKKIPPARSGSIEVRPVRELDLAATRPWLSR